MIRVRWDSDSLLDQPVEELAPRRGRASIEAKGELVEVVVEMAVPHGSLVSAHQPAFEQRKHRMHPRQHGFLDRRRHLHRYRFVDIALGFERSEEQQTELQSL